MTMTNAEWMIKNGYKFSDVCLKGSYDTIVISLNGKNLGKVRGTYSTAFQQWLDMEHKEQILDDIEKRYLSSFIKPFKDEIQSIEKSRNWANNSDRLYFNMKNRDIFYLPNFKAGTMYKGMEPDRWYTLKELGL